MQVSELIAYIKSLVPYVYYAYSYPTTSKDACALVIIGPGMPTENTGVLRPDVQILVRGEARDLENTERVAYELFEALKYKEDFLIGSSNVVELYSTQSAPLYTGQDENERHIFSLNFMATVRP